MQIWPDGVRCCAVLSFDLDADLFWSVWLDGKPTVLDRSQGQYGPKVGLPRILSMHEPDYFDNLAAMSLPRPILQVSGHTHGGQVCAPFVGPLILPRWGRNYPAGLYGEPGSGLYVTRGIGTVGPSARFLCRPEISLITLKA